MTLDEFNEKVLAPLAERYRLAERRKLAAELRRIRSQNRPLARSYLAHLYGDGDMTTDDFFRAWNIGRFGSENPVIGTSLRASLPHEYIAIEERP